MAVLLMDVVLILVACATGLLLVAAAFVYLIDPAWGQRLLRDIRVPAAVLVAVFVLSAIATVQGTFNIIVGFIAISVIAYVLRESRKPRREKPRSLGGAERIPVVPSAPPVDEEEKQPEQE